MRWCCPTFVFYLLSFGLSHEPVSAQPVSILGDSLVMEEAEAGLHLVYNLQFDSAAVLFGDITRAYPDHPIGPFFEGLNVWWQIMIDLHDESHDKRFNRLMQDVVDRAEVLLDDDPNNVDGLFFKGLGLSFRGRLHSNRRHWFRSIRDARGAIKQVIRLAETDAESNDFYFGWGVYDYFSDALLEEKKWLVPLKLFFPNGDRERGIKELERTFENGRLLRAEAAYFLFQIYTVYEPNYYRSLEYITWLRVRYPRNVIFRSLEARAYGRFGRWADAIPIYEEQLTEWEASNPDYPDEIAVQALYYLARAGMANGAYEDALGYLNRLNHLTESTKEESTFHVLGLLRQGMAMDALGYRDYAIMRYKQVVALKNWSDSRSRAKRYLKSPYRSPVPIVESGATAERQEAK
jgi:tetratricopeptide (TPR) repeat protein